MMEGFKEALEQRASEAERIILSYLPTEGGRQQRVCEAMNYSVRGGGKRLRPILMLEALRLFGTDEEKAWPFMAAIEMIHTYSLIHDDLPEMDNDDLRRGRPTCHIAYGQAMAVLAGDGLLNLAFEVTGKALADLFSEGETDMDTARRTAMASEVLARKAGYKGMIGGQTVDMLAEESGHVCDDGELMFIHKNKTAALLQAALVAGGLLGGADKEQTDRLERIGLLLGLAFQIRDDILDVTGDEEELGKPIGSDERNEKATYVSLHGLEAAEKRVRELSEEAEKELMQLPGDKECLSSLFSYLIERRK